MIVGVSFNQPLTKTDELNWSIIFVDCEPFATQRVVFVRIPVKVDNNLEIIWVSVRVRIEINEDYLIIAL